MLVLGSTNDSLLACLLGATSVNPLPPHYRCNNCHYTAFSRDRYKDGWDMPDAVCPVCGGSMEGDGHRLSSRSLAMPLPNTSAEMSQPFSSVFITCAVGSLSSTASSDGPV